MGIGLGNKRHLSLMLLIVSSVIVLDQLTKSPTSGTPARRSASWPAAMPGSACCSSG